MDVTFKAKLTRAALKDVEVLEKKDAEYGGSWKKRGGTGAYMMACRKFDRIEERVSKSFPTAPPVSSYDIFGHIVADQRPEGLMDDIRDLRRYLLLIEAEMLVRGEIEP